MRWLLLKDLQILRRSPLLVALLALYPVVVAMLIGAALTGGPEKPRVAFANLARRRRSSASAAARSTPTTYTARLFERSTRSASKTRAEAIAKVRDGEALARARDPRRRRRAPAGPAHARPPASRPRSRSSTTPRTRSSAATSSRRSARGWPRPTRRSSDAVLAQSARYLDLVVKGGKLSFPLVGDVEILGLRNARTLIDSSLRGLPADAPQRRRSSRSAASPSSRPTTSTSRGRSWPRSASRCGSSRRSSAARARRWTSSRSTVAATISLMLVTLLLAGGAAGARARGARVRAGSCAASSRAARCWRRRSCWRRSRRWSVTLAAAGGSWPVRRPRLERALAGRRWPAARWRSRRSAPRSAALAREVRVASLLAILLALPLAFLALVPSGAVSAGLYDTLNVVSGAFPFKPTLRALDG